MVVQEKLRVVAHARETAACGPTSSSAEEEASSVGTAGLDTSDIPANTIPASHSP